MTSKIPTSVVVALLFGSAIASGCDELDEIDLGRCGNEVLDAGEDCDGYPHPAGTACGSPGDARACRFTCEPECERSGVECEPEALCPVGWGCGFDGICRQFDGFVASFEDLGVVASPWMAVTDFDNDGREDLVFLDFAAVRVRYSRGAGRPGELFQFTTTPTGYAEVVDVDRDGFDDVVVPTREGLEILHGTAEPRLRAGVYPTLQVPSWDYRFARLELLSPVTSDISLSGVGDETLAMTDFGFIRFSFEELFVVGVDHPGLIKELVGPLGVGQIDETTYADEMVAAFAGRDAVHIYRFEPLAKPNPNRRDPPFAAQVTTIDIDQGTITGPDDLPAGLDDAFHGTPMGARLVHANAPVARLGGQSALCCNVGCTVRAPADEHLDVVVLTTDGLQTAYGLGDGSFHSDPCTLGATPPDQLFAKDVPSVSTSTDPPECSPLTVADLDGDGLLDVVTTTGVFLSTLTTPGVSFCDDAESAVRSPQSLWTRAETGDFNGDGERDVVTFNFARGDIDFLMGTGSSALGTITVPRVDLNAGAPQVGDFDGDGADDVAILAEQNVFEPYVQKLSVAWGGLGTGPSEIQLIGELPVVMAMAASSERATGAATTDGYDDLAVVTAEAVVEGNRVVEGESVIRYGNLLGRPDRRLTLPFKPTLAGENALAPTLAVYSPHAVAAGRFSFADEGAKALVTTVRFEAGFVSSTRPGVLGVGLSSSGTTAAPEGTSAPVVAGLVGELESEDVQQRYRAAAVDLGQGFQEPVIFEFVDNELTSRIHVPRFVDGSWEVPAPASLSAAPVGVNVATGPSDISLGGFSGVIPNTPLACDLGDPEGEHLLIMMVEDREHPFINVPDFDVPIPSPNRTVLYDLSPAALRAVREGAATIDPVVVVPDDGMVSGVACMDVTGDGKNEVVVSSVRMTVESPFDELPVTYDVGFRVRLDRTSLDPEGGLTPLEEIVTFAEDVIRETQGGGLAGVPTQGMVAGDLDGDGVQDLVFGGFDTTLVLYGKAANP